MQPLYFEIEGKTPIMAIPDADAHVDGHPVLTYRYAIYKDDNPNEHHTVDTAKLLSTDRMKNRNYMGTLTFEQPGKIFSYTADGYQELESREVEEVIECISHYRDNPALWQL